MSNAAQIAKLRAATGMGWVSAKLFFGSKPTALCDRILAAKATQKERILHDPTEDDPAFASQFTDAKTAAERSLQIFISELNAKQLARDPKSHPRQRPLGSCHFVWKEMKRILSEKHGIEWFSPAEMNPGFHFD